MRLGVAEEDVLLWVPAQFSVGAAADPEAASTAFAALPAAFCVLFFFFSFAAERESAAREKKRRA